MNLLLQMLLVILFIMALYGVIGMFLYVILSFFNIEYLTNWLFGDDVKED